MSNTAHAFANGKALIPFITCGDPSLAVTEQLIYAMADSGADLIELGIPFSDPTAEGPVAQEASIRALAAGVTTDKVFDLVGRIRERCAVPLAFVTYANVVYAYGAERFASRCAEVGVDAVVLPDVPLEEKDEFSGVFAANGVDLVSIVAPTSGARVAAIAAAAEGPVCLLGFSAGADGDDAGASAVAQTVAAVRAENPRVPCVVSLDDPTPEQVMAVAAAGDGVALGGAVVEIVAEHGEGCVGRVAEYVRAMKEAVRRA